MTPSPRRSFDARSELSFWACFAVVLALVSQALFPPQVMASVRSGHVAFMLCMETPGAAPIIDPVTAKLAATPDKSKSAQGPKCEKCLTSSVTALPPQTLSSIPAVYDAIVDVPSARTSDAPPKARGPPRPYSCGPPSKA